MEGICSQIDQLQGLTATLMEDQLSRVPAHGAGLASAGLWCLLSLPFECVASAGGWVVFQQDLEPFSRYAGSGHFWEI